MKLSIEVSVTELLDKLQRTPMRHDGTGKYRAVEVLDLKHLHRLIQFHLEKTALQRRTGGVAVEDKDGTLCLVQYIPDADK